MITQIRNVANRATFPVRYESGTADGICMLRTPPHVRRRDYRRCAKWNEGICVEYY